MTDHPPLILTLELDPNSFGWLDDLRRKHFPPERNVLSAHLTLFHKLDLSQIAAIGAALRDRPAIIPLSFSGLRSLGGGVAITVTSPALLALRAKLVAAVDGDLTAQDRQGFRPHVTIQNKVAPKVARALASSLEQGFRHARPAPP